MSLHLMPEFKNLRKLNVFGMVLSCLYLGVEDGGDGPYLFPETITNLLMTLVSGGNIPQFIPLIVWDRFEAAKCKTRAH